MNEEILVAIVIILLIADIPNFAKVGIFLAGILWMKYKPAKNDTMKIDLAKTCNSCDADTIGDNFTTYQQGDIYTDIENESAMYKMSAEYPSETVNQMSPVFSNSYLNDADDDLARRQRYMQERSREAMENRARVNPNTYRMYFGEEQETAENTPWWGEDQAQFNQEI